MARVVPWALNKCFQKELIKILSQFETINLGTPYNFTILLTKTSATILPLYYAFNGMKCPNLESLSTTTMIVENPWEIGRLLMKSNEISSQTCCGMGNGCSSPAGHACSALACWQTWHSHTYFLTCFHILGQKNWDKIRAKVLDIHHGPLFLRHATHIALDWLCPHYRVT